jgi:hypothetical protein
MTAFDDCFYGLFIAVTAQTLRRPASRYNRASKKSFLQEHRR